LGLLRRRKPTELERGLGYVFKDPKLLEIALTHISYANEVGGDVVHNERFEFLGDAVLELVITDMLMKRFRNCSEGDLSKIRAVVVSKKSLARIARRLQLGAFIRLSTSEENTGGRQKESILADAYEALVASIYYDGGLKKARKIVGKHFAEPIEAVEEGIWGVEDHKSRLQELVQERFRTTPTYQIIKEVGPDHDKTFFAVVMIGNKKYGVGSGRSKKDAEQQAARQTLVMLQFKGRAAKVEEVEKVEAKPTFEKKNRGGIESDEGARRSEPSEPRSSGIGRFVRRVFRRR